MGGGGGSHTTQYEKERIGVDRRKYGEVSKTGIQSQEDYDNIVKSQKAYNAIKKDDYYKTQTTTVFGNTQTTTVFDEQAYNKARSEASGGLTYDATYDRWSLASGVDLDAAKADWENYTSERSEIATYKAGESRRKAAPDSLTGTSGKVDYSLGIKEDDEEDKLSTTVKTVDTSPTTASTSQTLGIY